MNPSGLLVSVRDAEESQAALDGGADLIDVKDPAEGALGKAADSTILEVLRTVGGRRPVSAAFGELLERHPCSLPALAFAKWGLAGCAVRLDWRQRLLALATGTETRVVTVAYADWRCAQAPCLDEVVAFACENPEGILLIDTHCKEAAGPAGTTRPTLLDWLSKEEIEAILRACRRVGVRVALAGSLGDQEIRLLAPLRPDWFAVRGAACDRGRHGTVTAERVRRLAGIVRESYLKQDSRRLHDRTASPPADASAVEK